ncbi:type II toxin-antitoxin system RnlA family toxin [Maribacter sp. MAR_2009_72]|uniref:type II toxin-antitoxin system RnlA family toxin n=1 Tax=Maribacter sp. MAR_2009_72 TaxID=1250050 RepID=UPI00119A8E70|nr:type II toxin-antitoxin system RnlA family toxin [Maribacter sp. MAR_2009_72]TVZ14341.1 RnlA-like RNase toxin of RnlAB toxin-antitoxin system [Maribacter sp. MAR_2009_72]
MASEYKDLPINREKIDQMLNEYPGIKSFTKTEKPNGLFQYHLNTEGGPACLNVYLLKGGGTTFHPSGKNQEFTKSVAGFLKANCLRGDGETKSIRIANFPSEGKDLLFNFLKEECNAKVNNGDNHPHGKQYKIVGKDGDSVVFWIYTNGACHIQGRQYSVYTDILEMLAEIMDYREIIDSQLKTIKVDITAAEALGDMQVLLPSTFDFIKDKLKAIISPALALKKLDIELTDYSSFAFPVLRGLEGYLKQVLGHFGIVIGKDGFGEIVESNSVGRPVLTEFAREKITVTSKQKVILDLYKYFNKHRHGLFHVDSAIESARVLENKSECITLIDNTVILIEDSHKSLF